MGLAKFPVHSSPTWDSTTLECSFLMPLQGKHQLSLKTQPGHLLQEVFLTLLLSPHLGVEFCSTQHPCWVCCIAFISECFRYFPLSLSLNGWRVPWKQCAWVLSCVQLFVSPWTVTCQAPLSVGFSRQEYCSGLPCPPPGDLPNPGIEPVSLMSPALTGGFFPTSATWEAPLESWDNVCSSWYSQHPHNARHILSGSEQMQWVVQGLYGHFFELFGLGAELETKHSFSHQARFQPGCREPCSAMGLGCTWWARPDTTTGSMVWPCSTASQSETVRAPHVLPWVL